MAAPKTGPRPTLEELPTEIMTMILESSELHYNVEYNIIEGNFATETSKPILEATDIFSLRLASRQLEYKSLDAFGKRFFAVRNHMLSRRSVQCLREISASPKLSRYVKEVVIAPLRISPDMARYKEEKWRYEWASELMRGNSYDIDIDEEHELEVEEKVKRRQERKEKRLKQVEKKLQDEKEEWSQVHEPKWRALLQDQAAFDTECVVQIQRALKSLANLQQVHLAAFSFSKGKWDDTWGAKSIVRDLEVELGPGWDDVAHVVEDDIRRFRDKGLPAHLETML